MVPDLLKRLAEDISWTTNLGNAFLAQQQDVMDAVQRLRTKAKEAGKLESNDKMKVETKVVEQQTVVVIEPASPEVVYVPAYNPTVIWGPPVYAYPPVYYPPPPPGAMFFSFSVGVMMGAAMHGGYCCGCGWGHSNAVVVNNNNTFVNNRNVQNNVRASSRSSNWQHNPQHRGGAPYGDRATASKYGGGHPRRRRASTMDRGGQGGSNRGGPSASTMDRGGQGGSNRGGPSASTVDRGGQGASGTSDMSRGAAQEEATSVTVRCRLRPAGAPWRGRWRRRSSHGQQLARWVEHGRRVWRWRAGRWRARRWRARRRPSLAPKETRMRVLRVLLVVASLGIAVRSSAATPAAPKTFATPREAAGRASRRSRRPGRAGAARDLRPPRARGSSRPGMRSGTGTIGRSSPPRPARS